MAIRVLGWNKPHYFQNGNRIELTKDEARSMSVKFNQELFDRELGVKLLYSPTPNNRGEFKVVSSSCKDPKSLEFIIFYHDETQILEIHTELEKVCGGVSHRELFELLYSFLKKGERSISKDIVIKSHSLEDWEKTNKAKEAIVENKKAVEAFAGDFPMLFQKKYRRSIRFMTIAASSSWVILELWCQTGDDVASVKKFKGDGPTTKDAKNKAILNAVADGILN